MTIVASPLLLDFGAAVKRARVLKGWELNDLANRIAEMERGKPGTKANAPGKSFLSNVEKGKRAISPPTVGKLIRALDLPESWMDRFLDSDTAPDSEETAQDRDAERLMLMLERDAPAVPPAEALLIGLAQDFAGKPFFDHFSAYASLRQALSDAADLKAQGLLPSNTGDQLSLILRRVSDLNDQGLRDEAGEALNEAISRNEAEAEALFNAALKQDRVRNRPEDAARRLIANLRLREQTVGLFKAMRLEQDRWYVSGRDKGEVFDLEVSLELALQALSCAKKSELAYGLTDLGLSQFRLGERETKDSFLRAALKTFFFSWGNLLQKGSSKGWVTAHNNIGNVLVLLGRRQANAKFLNSAIEYYAKALDGGGQFVSPLDKAMTKQNIGAALTALGELDGDTVTLKIAIVSFKVALSYYDRGTLPEDWALTQNNIGFALHLLGKSCDGIDYLDSATEAYDFALSERSRTSFPFDWARTTLNIGHLECTYFEKTADSTRLTFAKSCASAAYEEFYKCKADHQIKECELLKERIDRLAVAVSS